MKIVVEEEFGYKYWLWEVDAPFDDIYYLVQEKISNPEFFSMNLPEQFPYGEWEEIKYEEYKHMTNHDEVDAYAHLHTQMDSYLERIQYKNETD